jgi:hypothetical protein
MQNKRIFICSFKLGRSTFCIRLLQLRAYPPQNMSTTQSFQTPRPSCLTQHHVMSHPLVSCQTPDRHTIYYRHACHPTIVMPAKAGISLCLPTTSGHAPHTSMPNPYYRHACVGRHLLFRCP